MVGQLHRAGKGDMPDVVGKVEEHHVGCLLPLQELGQRAAVARQPDGAVGRVKPVAAVLLALPGAVLVLLAGHMLLPVVPGGGERDVHVAHAEALTDVVAGSAGHMLLVTCDLGHVVAGMDLSGLVLDARQRLAGKVVVVDVGVEQRIEGGHVLGQDGRLHQHGHVEAHQQRVAHDGRAAAVEQEARVAQPVDGGGVTGAKGLGRQLHGLPRHGLSGCAATNLYAHDDSPSVVAWLHCTDGVHAMPQTERRLRPQVDKGGRSSIAPCTRAS